MNFLRTFSLSSKSPDKSGDYTQEKLQESLQTKLYKLLVNFVKKNPWENNKRNEYLKNFEIIAKVSRYDSDELLYIDVECNNYNKKADPEQSIPENFSPEMMEFPIIREDGTEIHSYINPKYFPVSNWIVKFCGYEDKMDDVLDEDNVVKNHVFKEDVSAITFEEAFLKFARLKVENNRPLTKSCIVSCGDFDEIFIAGELLRDNRAVKICNKLQEEFPDHPDLKGEIDDKKAWKIMEDMLRYINFKDEYHRFYDKIKRKKDVSDFTQIQDVLGLKYGENEHHHSGKDDTYNIKKAYEKVRELNQNSEPIFVKSFRIVNKLD